MRPFLFLGLALAACSATEAPASSAPASSAPASSAPASSAPASSAPASSAPAEARTSAPTMTLYDFSTDTDTGWFIVNDGVMGGHSDGHVSHDAGTLVFDGTLVTRDGGFTAARTDKAADMTGMTAVELAIVGDGRTYEMELSDGVFSRGEMVSRKAPFETTGERQTVRVAFADLDDTVFGEPVSVPTFDPTALAGMGIFMADGQDGPFRLEVRSIRAVE